MAALRAQAPIPRPSEQESVGGLVTRLGNDVTRIVRAEIGLVQLRVSSALDVAKGAGAGLAAGAVLGVIGLGIVMLGVVLVLARLMPIWEAAFLVGGVLLLASAGLFAVELRALTHGVTEALVSEDGRPDGAHRGE